jgi:hypothetical protein
VKSDVERDVGVTIALADVSADVKEKDGTDNIGIAAPQTLRFRRFKCSFFASVGFCH